MEPISLQMMCLCAKITTLKVTEIALNSLESHLTVVHANCTVHLSSCNQHLEYQFHYITHSIKCTDHKNKYSGEENSLISKTTILLCTNERTQRWHHNAVCCTSYSFKLHKALNNVFLHVYKLHEFYNFTSPLQHEGLYLIFTYRE